MCDDCSALCLHPWNSAGHSDLSADPCQVDVQYERNTEIQLADAVAPPSLPDPESSRRDRRDVKQEDECLEERGNRSFGPTITVGEPSCKDSGSKDSGRKRGNRDDDVSSSSRSTPTTTIQLPTASKHKQKQSFHNAGTTTHMFCVRRPDFLVQRKPPHENSKP